jgi:hypothetical protein
VKVEMEKEKVEGTRETEKVSLREILEEELVRPHRPRK